ncbi:MAG: SDR family NAD(P)-dependent oxidoreductase [Geminicoccaceae bacterium]
MRLQSRTAVITGSDSGMGQATAVDFAREGAQVVINYLEDEAGAQETLRGVSEAGQRGIVVQADVQDPAAVEKLFRRACDELGTPDILVNNAGVGSGGKPLAEVSLEEWDRVIRTDLYGPFFCCQQFIRLRKAAGGRGRIINVTSVHEEIPSPGNAAYGAAKGGLRNLTRSLALELAPDRINVNNIAPGLIHTPMTAARVEDPAKMREELPRIPWKRPGEPWEIGRLAVYLASDEADYVTGQTFTIDGGLEMNWGQGA